MIMNLVITKLMQKLAKIYVKKKFINYTILRLYNIRNEFI